MSVVFHQARDFFRRGFGLFPGVVLVGGSRPDKGGAVSAAAVCDGMLQAASRRILRAAATLHGEPSKERPFDYNPCDTLVSTFVLDLVCKN